MPDHRWTRRPSISTTSSPSIRTRRPTWAGEGLVWWDRLALLRSAGADACDEIDKWTEQLLSAPDALAAMAAMLSGPPPTGDVEHNRQQARRHRSEFVFAALATRQRISYEGMPQYQPTAEEQREELALAEIEDLALHYTGPIYAAALHRIGRHYASATHDLEAQLRALPAVPPGAARSLARAIAHYWNDENEAAALIALARIETFARTLLTALGEPLYKVQVGSRPGHYPTLGSLLARLRDHGLNESWHRYLQTLLVSPGIGWNVRNDRLHGLDDSDVAQPLAALVLVAALYLAFHETTEPDQ